MREKVWKVVFSAGVGFVLFFTLIFYGFGEWVNAVEKPVTLEVRSGDSLGGLVSRLSAQGVLKNPFMIKLLGIVRGDARRLKAGEYIVDKPLSPNEFLDYLVAGKTHFITLSIPEGFNLKGIAARIESLGIGSGKAFLKWSTDPEFIRSLGVPYNRKFPTLEGMVFPDTYHFSKGVEIRVLLKAMVGQFEKKARQMVAQKAAQVSMTPYEVLILASIIEKETGQAYERPTISSVFHNRLKLRMRLGTDPTVIYGIKNFDGNITRKHLRTPTPYNTYTNYGLPPTPISNPGLASLKAALYPTREKYLYFVSRGDGSHVFTKNLKSHNKAVWEYQKKPFMRKNRKNRKRR